MAQNQVAISGEQSTEHLESIAGSIELIERLANCLAETLPSLDVTISEIKTADTRIEESVKHISVDNDPVVAKNILELKQQFRACIRDGKSFLEACLTMAMYATNEGHVEEIKNELGDLSHPSLDLLKTYIDDLCSYLEECSDTLELYRIGKASVEEKVSDQMTDYDMKVSESKKDVRSAGDEFANAHFACDAHAVREKAGRVIECVHLAAGDKIEAIISHFKELVDERISEGLAAKAKYKKEQIYEEKMKERKVFEDALRRIWNLQKSMSEAFGFIEGMNENAKRVSKLIDGERGLKHHQKQFEKEHKQEDQHLDTDSNKTSKPAKKIHGYHDISNKLDSLQRTTQKIVKELGEDGNKISKDEDELIVSNTTAQQDTDTAEVKLTEAFKETLKIQNDSEATQANTSGASGLLFSRSHDVNAASVPVFTVACEEQKKPVHNRDQFVSGFKTTVSRSDSTLL